MTDPAAALVEYRRGTGDGGWAQAEGAIRELDAQQQGGCDELALEHLNGAYYVAQAKEYLAQQGVPMRLT